MTEPFTYSINSVGEYSCNSSISFIFSANQEERSLSTLSELQNQGISIKNIVLILYSDFLIPEKYKNIFLEADVYRIHVDSNPMNFVLGIKSLPDSIWSNELLLDISCVRIPELFTLFKYLKVQEVVHSLNVAYSIPYDYIFSGQPFTSYQSYSGDLKMFEPLGFSGPGGSINVKDLYVFLGFEGALGLKVFENCQYTNLILVNNLPAFSPKYKDISVINNYQLMQNHHRYLYASADNPFEVYNMLDSILGDNSTPVCIAPLSTKLVALGICLYALEHEYIRIVYPVSNQYKEYTTLNTYQTNIYSIVI